MKKAVFVFLWAIFANIAVFSQTAVPVPSNFIGTWWFDATQEYDTYNNGIQALLSLEVKGDGSWIFSIKFIAINQMGFNFLESREMTNGHTMIGASGYITGATSVEIVLTRTGENGVFDRFVIDGTAIADTGRRRWTKSEPEHQRE